MWLLLSAPWAERTNNHQFSPLIPYRNIIMEISQEKLYLYSVA